MRVIFCSDYWNPRAPEPTYEAEVAAAQSAGLEFSLLNFEALAEQQNALRAVHKIEQAEEQETALYRGWMLKPETYKRLYEALAEKGLMLLNTPADYRHCHYLPESYPIIAGRTPLTVWLPTGPDVSIDEVITTLHPFGEKAVIVKDYVKSRKHEWLDACYIPSAADREAVERVVRRFLQLQGEDLNMGLVFREFVEFEPLTTHSRSGMPLTREYRLFVLDGKFILIAPYWEEGEYGQSGADQLPLDHLSEIARQVHSRFFTMDVARRVNGTWNIVELGDGQVAGLPARADITAFYRALAGSLAVS
ncbi:MAG TPA: ATP-grasp domain-containing protein [Ktedonobacteraceae bacterium]